MAYEVRLARKTPGCFLFLIDQSGSMSDDWGGKDSKDRTKTKADAVVAIINRTIKNLEAECTKGANDVRDNFYIGIIGYGDGKTTPLFLDENGEPILISKFIADPRVKKITETIEVDVGDGRTIKKQKETKIYIESTADGNTPMCEALDRALGIIKKWVSEHSESFPPIIINISDGEGNDGDPRIIANQIKQITTSDGNVLLFNAHISSTACDPILYPSDSTFLVDEFALKLFEMSSVIPEKMRQNAKNQKLENNSRGYIYNAKENDLAGFLEFGTQSAPRESQL